MRLISRGIFLSKEFLSVSKIKECIGLFKRPGKRGGNGYGNGTDRKYKTPTDEYAAVPKKTKLEDITAFRLNTPRAMSVFLCETRMHILHGTKTRMVSVPR